MEYECNNINPYHNNNDLQCVYHPFGCEYKANNQIELYEHYNSLSSINYHLKIISEKVLLLLDLIKEQRESSFRLEKLFSNFPRSIQTYSIRKQKRKMKQLLKKHSEEQDKINHVIDISEIEKAPKEISSNIDKMINSTNQRTLSSKFIFGNGLLNNKNIRWKAKFNIIRGNEFLGICSVPSNYKKPQTQIEVENIIDNNCYLLNFNLLQRNCSNPEEDRCLGDGNRELNKDEIYYCEYRYIEKKLRIFNERFHKVFTNVIPINNGKLYPCAIVDINDNERAIEFFELIEMEEDDDIPIINII